MHLLGYTIQYYMHLDVNTCSWRLAWRYIVRELIAISSGDRPQSAWELFCYHQSCGYDDQLLIVHVPVSRIRAYGDWTVHKNRLLEHCKRRILGIRTQSQWKQPRKRPQVLLYKLN